MPRYALFKDGKQISKSYNHEWQIGFFEANALAIVMNSTFELIESFEIREVPEVSNE